uniref:Ubiquitin-related modifier 1 homolog n=1 Tax=Wuchereria bancrofti TaxID=6293 RepID=A0AAF5PWZ0_WUCBA
MKIFKILKLEFSGGAESLFDMQREFDVQVPNDSGPLLISDLVRYININLIPDKSRSHLLVDKDGEGVRPGILVLVNDVDWEVLQGPKTVLEDGDIVSFISTLHGG